MKFEIFAGLGRSFSETQSHGIYKYSGNGKNGIQPCMNTSLMEGMHELLGQNKIKLIND